MGIKRTTLSYNKMIACEANSGNESSTFSFQRNGDKGLQRLPYNAMINGEAETGSMEVATVVQGGEQAQACRRCHVFYWLW